VQNLPPSLMGQMNAMSISPVKKKSRTKAKVRRYIVSEILLEMVLEFVSQLCRRLFQFIIFLMQLTIY
jgi:hypothetical protein